MSLQSQINTINRKTFEDPDCHDKRIWKLEKWQIKIAVIVSAGAVIIVGLALWFITYSMNQIADRILGG